MGGRWLGPLLSGAIHLEDCPCQIGDLVRGRLSKVEAVAQRDCVEGLVDGHEGLKRDAVRVGGGQHQPADSACMALNSRSAGAQQSGAAGRGDASVSTGYSGSAVGLASYDSWGAGWRSPEADARLRENLDYCWRFFVGQAEAQKACTRLVAILEAEGLAYAIIGALALNEYGHRRVTVDVDLIMREEDLRAFKAKYLGEGYAERVPGTGKLLDTTLDVHVDVLSTGRFPGDDKPKPIAFPDPVTTAIRGESFALLPMPRFIELKLASGMVAPHRAKDLVDIQELVRSASLPKETADDLHAWVRAKFLELWDLAQVEDPF